MELQAGQRERRPRGLNGEGTAQVEAAAFVAPQLATLAAEPPEGEQWLHEIKFDGYRVIAAIADGQVRLLARGGQRLDRAASARSPPTSPR